MNASKLVKKDETTAGDANQCLTNVRLFKDVFFWYCTFASGVGISYAEMSWLSLGHFRNEKLGFVY